MDNATDVPYNSTIPFTRQFNPPKPLLVDRVQLALLLMLLLIGAPINLVSLTKLRGRGTLARKSRLVLLRLHLNISDLMVLFIYATSSVCWQLTYEWRGGDVLCKVVKFANSTSFQLSSNIIVCVALDRLFTILSGTVFYKRYVNRHPARYVRICVFISWIVAIGVNILQFFVWVVIAPFPHTAPNWRQCTTVWAASAHFDRLALMQPELHKNLEPLKTTFQLNKFAYNVFHIAAVFWIPAAVIVFSYTIVVFHMFKLSAKKKSSTKKLINASLAEDNATQLSNIPLNVEVVTGRKNDANLPVKTTTVINNTSKPGNEKVDEAQDATTGPGGNSAKNCLLPVAIHRMRNKTFRTSVILVLAYFICWTPYNVLALWQFFDEVGYRRYAVGMKFLNVLIVFNSVVNPFLYGTLKCKLPWRRIQKC